MPKKQKRFADEGWAIWVDGDDTSTVYFHDWLNPKDKSYIDLAIRIRGIKSSKSLHVYVPFAVTAEEMEDVSLRFDDKKILQATFSASCLVDYKKNAHTSEIAYNGKTVDIVHISTLEYETIELPVGTLINISFEKVQPFIDNDEAYFIWRMPHKTLDAIFKPRVDVENIIDRLRDLITTPVVSEKYGYAIRINEPRLLPEQVTKIGMFHRQKLKKAVVTLSIDENYELNDATCNRIRRLEENLYADFLPEGHTCENVITYRWQQNRDDRLKGHFSFYYNIMKNSVSKSSMFLYMVLLLSIGIVGDLLAELVKRLLGISG